MIKPLSDEATKGLSQRWIEGEWDTSDDEESNIFDFIDTIAQKALRDALRQVVVRLEFAKNWSPELVVGNINEIIQEFKKQAESK